MPRFRALFRPRKGWQGRYAGQGRRDQAETADHFATIVTLNLFRVQLSACEAHQSWMLKQVQHG
jgi:hypothetical protein